jgi:hypothetical protein
LPIVFCIIDYGVGSGELGVGSWELGVGSGDFGFWILDFGHKRSLTPTLYPLPSTP